MQNSWHSVSLPSCWGRVCTDLREGCGVGGAQAEDSYT